MDFATAKLFAGALALLPLFGVGLGLGRLFSTFVEAVSRNPGAQKEIRTFGLLGAAFTEAIAIFALVVAILILFVIKP